MRKSNRQKRALARSATSNSKEHGVAYAAAITFLQIARPALRNAADLLEDINTWIPTMSGFDYPRKVGRREYLPVTWDERDALGRPVLHRLDQGSSPSLGPIATAKGIAVIEPGVGRISPGLSFQVEPRLCGLRLGPLSDCCCP